MAIEIEDVTRDWFDERFPIPQDQIEVINRYLVTGEKEELATHD